MIRRSQWSGESLNTQESYALDLFDTIILCDVELKRRELDKWATPDAKSTREEPRRDRQGERECR